MRGDIKEEYNIQQIVPQGKGEAGQSNERKSERR